MEAHSYRSLPPLRTRLQEDRDLVRQSIVFTVYPEIAGFEDLRWLFLVPNDYNYEQFDREMRRATRELDIAIFNGVCGG